jgi:hypothetical protein
VNAERGSAVTTTAQKDFSARHLLRLLLPVASAVRRAKWRQCASRAHLPQQFLLCAPLLPLLVHLLTELAPTDHARLKGDGHRRCNASCISIVQEVLASQDVWFARHGLLPHATWHCPDPAIRDRDGKLLGDYAEEGNFRQQSKQLTKHVRAHPRALPIGFSNCCRESQLLMHKSATAPGILSVGLSL